MRLPSPPAQYDAELEAQFRRQVEQRLSQGVTYIMLGGGRLYEEPTTGKLMFLGRSGTVTQLALP